ncbi:hypothetical protein B296_00024504, partial [Ensete ventricosum]
MLCRTANAKSAKPVTMWYQSGTSICRNTRHTNMRDLAGMIGAAGELDCFSAHIRLREPSKSEDKTECKSTNSRAMDLAASWYRRDETSVESSIPCSPGGRALVVKGAEEPSSLTFSTIKRMGEVEYPSSLTYPVEELCISS